MKANFRRNMIWLHTYSGLVGGWLLLVIFVTGTLSYYNDEISQWMQPELGSVSAPGDLINKALLQLNQQSVHAKKWQITLPNSRSNQFNIKWSTSLERRAKTHMLILEVATLAPIEPRATHGGKFFEQFHYTLQLRGLGGRYITGIAAMFMLIAIFSGIFTHRRFFKDFFTLRFKNMLKGLTDLHAIVGIITLPFCFVISFSALAIYTSMYVPWSANYHYQDGFKELDKRVTTRIDRISPAKIVATPITDFSKILSKINQEWPDNNAISSIAYQYPFDLNGRIIVTQDNKHSLSNKRQQLIFSSVDGQLLNDFAPEGVARTIRRIFYGLHQAHFAAAGLRAMLFFMGVASSVLIGSGLIIWLSKRLNKLKVKGLGHQIAERLNVATIAGLLIAVIGYFYANRLLAVELVGREVYETRAFFISWLLVAAYSLLRPAVKAWRELLLYCAFAYVLLPVLDVAINHRWLMMAISHYNFSYIAVEIAMVTTSIICWGFYRWLKGASNA